MPLYPPFGPYLLDTTLFGIPVQLRWYGVLIVAGALVAARLAEQRARHRGYNAEHVWNLLLWGMALGIIGARAYYVAFEWPQYAGRPLIDIVSPAGGGLAIHGALIGAIITVLVYTRWHHLPTLAWVDVCLPTVLVAQAIGRWGNFFNQEAYGRPTSLPLGVRIDPERRLAPYHDMQQYPPDTLFHATFLYESVWNIVGFGIIVWLERRYRRWVRTGDIALWYALWYGVGRFWIEGLRTDSLCTNGIGGGCEGALRAAQIASLALAGSGIIGLIINHLRRQPPEFTTVSVVK